LINDILKESLSKLLDKCKNLGINNLIGSSGSYETFADLVKYEFNVTKIRETDSCNTINVDYFNEVHKKLISFNYDQRKNMPGMEFIRVRLIPMASVITKYIIDELGIKLMIQSNYSIKEGLIFDYLSNK
jgi:exopolyphosphatase/guanosine-5'-triphosphate,3'-diphosphate pyrophosphatase